MTLSDKILELEKSLKKLKKVICCKIQAGTPTDADTPVKAEGTILYDDDFIYVNTSAGWKKVALSSV